MRQSTGWWRPKLPPDLDCENDSEKEEKPMQQSFKNIHIPDGGADSEAAKEILAGKTKTSLIFILRNWPMQQQFWPGDITSKYPYYFMTVDYDSKLIQ